MDKRNAAELFGIKIAHVGINATGSQQALSLANEFLDLMGLETRETPTACFGGELVEIMKGTGRGTNGHIGFEVEDCEAVLAYLESRGMVADEETKIYDTQGRCIFVYFKNEIGGFAFHLMQR